MMRESGLVDRLGADHFHMSPYRAVAAILRSRGDYEQYFGTTLVDRDGSASR
jgi:hypothetical protein